MPLNDPRLDALYRDLVARYGKTEADRRIRAAQDDAMTALDALIRDQTEARARARNEVPKHAPAVPGSTFVMYLAKDVELWSLPRSPEGKSP